MSRVYDFNIRGTITGRLSRPEPELRVLPSAEEAQRYMADHVLPILCGTGVHVCCIDLTTDFASAERRLLMLQSLGQVVIEPIDLGHDIETFQAVNRSLRESFNTGLKFIDTTDVILAFDNFNTAACKATNIFEAYGRTVHEFDYHCMPAPTAVPADKSTKKNWWDRRSEDRQGANIMDSRKRERARRARKRK